MSRKPAKNIQVRYFALLRELRGRSEEILATTADTPRELYDELRRRHGLQLPPAALRVAVNDAYGGWDVPLSDDDCVVFIQPVAGG